MNIFNWQQKNHFVMFSSIKVEKREKKILHTNKSILQKKSVKIS